MYAPGSGGFDTNTVIEIAEQVFGEKIEKIQKQVDEFSEFKSLTESKIENISDRLKRIELMIDKMQVDILDKVGSYGENLGSIKKEMGMMQDSFGKMINSVADRVSSKRRTSTVKRRKTTKRKTSKKK